MRHHFTLTRRARIKEKENNKCPQRHKEIGTLIHLLVEPLYICWMETGAVALENILAVSQKVKHRTAK